MSLASRAYKILCARYRDILLHQQIRRRRQDQRRSCRSDVGGGDPISKLERLEPRVLFTAVTGVDPLEGSHAALISTNISATFDENINNATVSDQTFVVHGQQSGRLLSVNGDITSLGASGTVVTLDPASNFHPGERVQATVTGGNTSTTPMSATPFVWQFRTAVPGGSGNFTDSSPALGNHGSYGVTLGDLDGDGDLDAFVANFDQGNRVWLNDGSGNFTDSGQGLGNYGSFDVSLGDVDGDGDLDAFVANRSQGNRVWLNDSSGNFTDSGQGLGDHDSLGVTLGDVDGDGDLDAFVAIFVGEGNRVWLNDGNGNFTDSGQALGNHYSFSVSLGDVDDDGDLDAFVANSNQGNRVWLNGVTDLSITKTSNRVAVIEGGVVQYTITVTNNGPADVMGATVRDLFPDTLTGVTWTAVIAGTGTATLAGNSDINESIDLTSGSVITYTVTGTVVASLTPNQAVQQIVTNPATVMVPVGTIDTDPTNNAAHDSDIVVLAVTGGSGNFTDSSQILGDHNSYGVTLGDVDGDGDLDAFVANGTGGNRVWFNDGSGSFTDSSQALGNNASLGVILGDVDGDGDLDAFVANRFQSNRVWLNDGSGNFTDSSQALGNASSYGVTLGDLDGDGDLDAFVANEFQANRVWFNNGSGNFTASAQVLGNQDSRSVTLGDLDGDGDLDVFLATRSRVNLVLLNDGSGNFTANDQVLDHDSRSVTLGDVDGDGDLDAFVASRHQGNRVLLNDGSGNLTDSGQSLGDHYSFGVSLGDVDGDGDLDAFVANSATQGNRVWLNDGSGTFSDSNQSLSNHGSRSVTLGDLDGDGDLDAFVANRTQGNRVWLNRDAATVVGRHIFYNNSAYDSVSDDDAIAPSPDNASDMSLGKTALLPGEVATFENYTSYSRGINGIMVDLANTVDVSLISASDFTFMVSTDGIDWTNAPPPTSVTTLPVVVDGKNLDRVTIIWDDNEIENKWLEVTIAANSATTGLTSPDVFYFGNAIGETGNNDGINATVDVTDLIAMRQNASPIGAAESITNLYDFNRDARVDLFDLIIVRDHMSTLAGELSLIPSPSLSPPGPLIDAAPSSLAVDLVIGDSTSSGEVRAPFSSQQIRILQSAMHQWRLSDLQASRRDRLGESRRAAGHGQVLTKLLEGLGGESAVN